MGKYENELDYLLKSLDFVEERFTSSLAGLKEAKEAIASLQVDVPNITTPKLRDAAMKTHNHFTMEKRKFEDLIKEIREDRKWINKLIKIVRVNGKRGKQ